jgi:hypothetical protein
MTPHPPHHIHVPRRTVRRSIALFAALLVIGGTPLVARALDDEATPVADTDADLAAAPAAPAAPEAPDVAVRAMDEPASVLPGAVAERTVDPVVAVLTDTYVWDERAPRVAVLQRTLGVAVDGWYSPVTNQMHRAALEALGLPTDTVPVPPVPLTPAGTSAEQWAALRECESGGDYSITNPSGKYRGAYQFDRPTWDSVAVNHAPHLVGVDPAAASPADQDAMAFALYSERGAGPWPQCGRHLR